MSSSVHYKFRATIEYKTLTFDGLSILGSDLKREICTREGIRAEAFDLKLQNAQTKRNYANEDLIPRNSSVIVQRVPKENAEKLPKIQSGSGGIVSKQVAPGPSVPVEPVHMDRAEFEKMSEEDQIAHIKDVSTAKYLPSNYQKRAGGIYSGKPPPTYICHRCNEPGHWSNNCPMIKTKLTTGIPSQELMETTKDDPHAMLHPSGKYVIPIKHWEARNKKVITSDGNVSVERKPPAELTCPLCGQILRDAVLTVCCGESFCADCINEKLMESENRACPGQNCKAEGVLVDSLVPNLKVRQAANTWLTSGTDAPAAPAPPPQRVRIGLRREERPVVTLTRATAPTVIQVGIQPMPGTVIPSQQVPHVATYNVPILPGQVPMQPSTAMTQPLPPGVSIPPQQHQPTILPTTIIRPTISLHRTMIQPQVPIARPQPEVLLPPGVSATPMAPVMPAIPASAAVALTLDSLRPAPHTFSQPPPPGLYSAPLLFPPGIGPSSGFGGKGDPLDEFIQKLRSKDNLRRRKHRSRSGSTFSSSSSSSSSDRRRHDRRRYHHHERERSRERERGSTSRRYPPPSSSSKGHGRLYERREGNVTNMLAPPGVDGPYVHNRPASLLETDFAAPPGVRMGSNFYRAGEAPSSRREPEKSREKDHGRKRERDHRSERREEGERVEKRRKEERRKRPHGEEMPKKRHNDKGAVDDIDEEQRKEEEAIDASLKEIQQLEGVVSSGDHSEADFADEPKKQKREKDEESGSGAENEDDTVGAVVKADETTVPKDGPMETDASKAEESDSKRHRHKKEKKEKHHKKHKKHKHEGETEQEREERKRKKKEKKEKKHKERRHSGSHERVERKSSRDEAKVEPAEEKKDSERRREEKKDEPRKDKERRESSDHRRRDEKKTEEKKREGAKSNSDKKADASKEKRSTTETKEKSRPEEKRPAVPKDLKDAEKPTKKPRREGRGDLLERELIRRRNEKRAQERREREASGKDSAGDDNISEHSSTLYVSNDASRLDKKERPSVTQVFAIATGKDLSPSKIKMVIKK